MNTIDAYGPMCRITLINSRFFRLNTYMSTGEVKMTMMLLKPAGEMVGTYTGLVRFDEDFTPNDEMQPGDRLNRAFSQALGQIRDDMLADTKLPKARLTEPVAQRHGSDGHL